MGATGPEIDFSLLLRFGHAELAVWMTALAIFCAKRRLKNS
jgi:hypothetical protein